MLRNRLPEFARKCHGQGKLSPYLPPSFHYHPKHIQTNSSQWYPEVLHFCPYTPLILLGLKSDLRYKKACIDMLKTQGLTPVTTEQGLAVANKMGAQYMECSSKEMKGVEEIFDHAILTVVANDRKNLEMQAASSNTPGGGIGGIGPLKKKKRKCITL